MSGYDIAARRRFRLIETVAQKREFQTGGREIVAFCALAA
jgi:hypothetical protein